MDPRMGTIVGGCRIEAEIGRGGMGIVYKAHHLALDIPVAVKILQTASPMKNAEERFLREARMAAKLKNPHIVSCLNVGVEQGVHFIIMEYVDGENLRTLFERKGRLSSNEAVKIACEVLGALQDAMNNGIVHRDIKPENILIERSGSAKLADLGLARTAGDMSLTQSDCTLGSPFYVAPEQAENPGKADIRADVYSMGCTLFHILTGCTPYKGNTIVEIILNHLNKPVPYARDVNKDLPDGLCKVIFKMMQKNPDQRFQTPSEAISALSAAVNSKAGSEKVPEFTESTKIDGKRKYPYLIPLVLISAVVFTVVLLVSFLRHGNVQKKTNVNDQAVIEEPFRSGAVSNTKKAIKNPVKSTTEKPVKKKNEKTEDLVGKDNGRSTNIENPVMRSVKIGDSERLKRLLDKGVSPNAAPGASTSPLHEAVKLGSAENVELLLQKGANPNMADNRGDTPLHYALRDDAVFIVNLLLKYGANPNIADHQGRKPLKTASAIDSELERLLKKYGAN